MSSYSYTYSISRPLRLHTREASRAMDRTPTALRVSTPRQQTARAGCIRPVQQQLRATCRWAAFECTRAGYYAWSGILTRLCLSELSGQVVRPCANSTIAGSSHLFADEDRSPVSLAVQDEPQISVSACLSYTTRGTGNALLCRASIAIPLLCVWTGSALLYIGYACLRTEGTRHAYNILLMCAAGSRPT